MAIVKGVLIAVIGLVVVFFGVGLLLPDSAHVERSILIDAPPATVFTLTNGFARFNEWSPWAGRDPEAVYTYEGPAFGVGARMHWASNDPNVGTGHQEIVGSTPFEEVRTRLDFGEQGTAEAFFRFKPAEPGVEVTWGFDTDFGADIAGRWFGLMFDSWVGQDYEEGLANLKRLAESLPDDDWSELEIGIVRMEPIAIASVRGECEHTAEAVGPALADAYAEVNRFLARRRIGTAGMPVVINHEWRETYAFEAGIPIAVPPGGEPAGSDRVAIGATPSGAMVRAVHVGPGTEMGVTYSKLKAWAAAHGVELTEPAWEQVVSDPGEVAEHELVTLIYYPVR